MQTLYLIGNGFDINSGLDTGAKKFVKKLKTHLEEREGRMNSGEEVLFKSLRDDIETWADFEMALGHLTQDVDSYDNPSVVFEEAYVAFHDYFSTEIQRENARACNVEISQDLSAAFRKAITSVFDDVMSLSDKAMLDSSFKPGGCSIRFITFNYTCLLDRLIGSGINDRIETRKGGPTSVEAPLHIHGTLDDDRGILIGVDNEEQIAGVSCRENNDVRNMLVKPVSNDRTGMLRDATASRLIESLTSSAYMECRLGQVTRSGGRRFATGYQTRTSQAGCLSLRSKSPTSQYTVTGSCLGVGMTSLKIFYTRQE